jgi:hypothetical protein
MFAEYDRIAFESRSHDATFTDMLGKSISENFSAS